MLNRVDVYVVNMSGKIFVVPDCVFPKPPLPEGAARPIPLVGCFARPLSAVGKHGLDAAPAVREIRITLWQG
jgi:hypothetical protein